MKTYMIPTSSAEHIGAKLRDMGGDVLFLGKNKDGKNVFPDGEIYASVPDIHFLQGERVVIIHSGMPKPNDGLEELRYVLDVLNEPVEAEDLGNKRFMSRDLEKPASIDVFFTYFPYGRHDKPFVTGGANRAKGIMNDMINHNVNQIYTIDLHCSDAGWLKKYPVTNISANDVLVAAMEKDGYTDILKLAPDVGAQVRNGIGGFDKKRENSFDVKMQAGQELNVRGKDVVIVDDIISTGGTMLKAWDKMIELCANDVLAAITHGVMPEGIEKVSKSYKKLYLTNTINRPEANVDISRLVLDAIAKYEPKKIEK